MKRLPDTFQRFQEALPTWTFKHLLKSENETTHWAWQKAREALVQLGNDPDCTLSIHGRDLKMPLSHDLPIEMKQHPHFNTLPGRVAAFLRDHRDGLTIVDVGANIGDTIASFNLQETENLLAIEPSKFFRKYLEANWGDQKNIRISDRIVSSRNGECLSIKESHGSGKVVQSTGYASASKTLDTILETEGAPFNQPDLIKIDTDGHDFDVLLGATSAIQENWPVVLFETDSALDEDYVDKCEAAFSFFGNTGYKSFLVYDNHGYLMSHFLLTESDHFKQAVWHQITSNAHHFDLLFIPPFETTEFVEAEKHYYLSRHSMKSTRKSAESLSLVS